MHGYVHFVLKESLRYIPVLGVGMKFYGFIFLSRKCAKDKARFQYRLRKMTKSGSRSGVAPQSLAPMWLLMFPEGTNLCKSGRASSQRWAERNNLNDLRHSMLPRSTASCTVSLSYGTLWSISTTALLRTRAYRECSATSTMHAGGLQSVVRTNTAKITSLSKRRTSKAGLQDLLVCTGAVLR